MLRLSWKWSGLALKTAGYRNAPAQNAITLILTATRRLIRAERGKHPAQASGEQDVEPVGSFVPVDRVRCKGGQAHRHIFRTLSCAVLNPFSRMGDDGLTWFDVKKLLAR